MTNPRTLFDIGRRNRIVNHFLELWMQGDIVWEDKNLIRLATTLEEECNNFADKHDLRALITETKAFPSLLTPVLEITLVPDVSQITNPSERQSRLISAIAQIDFFSENLLRLLKSQLKYSASSAIVIKKLD